MSNPRSISKSLRFSVLDKFGFRCAYCGAGAPEVKLIVEHVRAVVTGGSNNDDNLVAACVPCNEGKGPDELLTTIHIPAPKARRLGRGRPTLAPEERKQQITFRLSPEVLDALRATGPGWRTRVDAILRERLID